MQWERFGSATDGGQGPPCVAAKDKLEEAAGQESAGAECDGGVPAKVGATQRCVLTALDGTTIGVTATVTSVKGDDVSVDFKADDEPQQVKRSSAIR